MSEAAWMPPAELLDIVKRFDPDATPEKAAKLATDLLGIAKFFLMEQDAAADRRTARDGCEQYERIAKSARELRLALCDRATPGSLLGPLANLRTHAHAGHAEESAVPSNLDTAYGICWPWGLDAHPLHFVEQVAKQVAADLAVDASKGGKATLHDRQRGNPRTALAIACGRWMADVRRGPLNISVSESGELAELTARVWKFATGTEAPSGLGFHAKKAAQKLRKALDAQ
jgi:hypothetical protein